VPTYDYQCENGHHFEVFQKMTEPKLEICPQCGGRVERLIGPGAGIVFKGSGFYSTDYRSEKYRRAARSDSGTGDPAAPSTSGKSASAAGGATKNKAGQGTSQPGEKTPEKAPAESPEPKPAAGGGSAAQD
jgi:putative FmdB family regulatory protein